ncbi:MAG: sulfurtransferase TusA family protein [Alphaproteobacteria bacterium]|nr:MAG: sulfurtransferase TusA family protein [Alphaproteobacteria bacterium]
MLDEQDNSIEVSDCLDITHDLCPMTFVKARLFLEKCQPSQIVEILLSEGEPLENLPEALTLDGHALLSLDELPKSSEEETIPDSRQYRLILQVGDDSAA